MDAGRLDTSHEAADELTATWRARSVADRARMVDALCRDVELLARAQIATERPGLSEPEICHELARRRYGPTLADAAYAGLQPTG